MEQGLCKYWYRPWYGMHCHSIPRIRRCVKQKGDLHFAEGLLARLRWFGGWIFSCYKNIGSYGTVKERLHEEAWQWNGWRKPLLRTAILPLYIYPPLVQGHQFPQLTEEKLMSQYFRNSGTLYRLHFTLISTADSLCMYCYIYCNWAWMTETFITKNWLHWRHT